MKGPVFEVWSPDDDIPYEDRDKPVRSGKFSLKRKGVGMILFDEYEDHVDMYCPHCLKYADVKNKLGARILEKDKPIPADHELWRSCYVCGNTYGFHEVEKQKKLKVSDLKEHITENPFEANQTLIESIPKRTSSAGKKASARSNRERHRQHHKDPEIDALMRIYGERVTVLEDSDP